MKAERRHELQENTLAHVLSNFPLYLSIYATRILTVVLIVVLAVVLLRYRATAKQQQIETTRINLAHARDAVGQMQSLVGGLRPSPDVASARANLLNDATAALEAVLANADTDAIKAEAYIARADLYWAAANLPDLPGAATQPSLALPQPRDALLAKAASDYETVLQNHRNQPIAVASAYLGLAAIAENQGRFTDAEKYYTQLKQSESTPGVFKTVAELRLEDLPTISKPRRLIAATRPAPSTQPDETPAEVESPASSRAESPATRPE
jgi:tetratricopeptide (TPR) repeat protein